MFDWYRYLKTLPTVRTGADGKLYIISAEEAEKERRARLQNTTSLLATGNAFLDKTGIVSVDNSGVHHQPHRFHYGK